MSRKSPILHPLTLLFLVYVNVLAGITATGESKPVFNSLTEDQKILHLLNRLGYGARPGDVERVRALGLEKYINQQLSAAAIDDSAAEAKVRGLEVFSMSTAELFAKYPNPGALLRRLEGGREAQSRRSQARDPNSAAPDGQYSADDTDRRERRQKLSALYREYDLRPAAQILPQVTANRVLRAVYSERQLQEVMVDFWQNHFNVFAGKAAVRWYIPSYERDVLRKNALGNFKDLVIGTAQHPAMLFYLDNFESVSPTSQPTAGRPGVQRLREAILDGGNLPDRMRERLKRQYGVNDAQLDQLLKDMRSGSLPLQQRQRQRGINENYARELMELHTLGVDGGYTQKDIVEVAKAFTGWTIADPRGYRRAAARMINGGGDGQLARLQLPAIARDGIESGEFYFNDRWHEKGPKTVLGQKIDAGGIKDGLRVIDILVAHPSTARFIAKKLAIKFVSDTPSDRLVNRVATAFRDSSGDIKATLRTLFSDKEFFAAENYRSKIKTPFELAISSIRVLGAETNGGAAMFAMLNKLGELPYGYQAPTGYPETAEDWVNTGALLERLNFAIALASNRIPGTTADLKRFGARNRADILDKSITAILSGEMSAATRETLIKQIERPLPEVKAGSEAADDESVVPNMRGGGEEGGRRVRQARLLPPSGDPEIFKVVSLVIGSPEFQRQ